MITESTNAAIILTAALTATFAPLGFNILMEEPEGQTKRIKLIFGSSDLVIQVGKILNSHGDGVLFLTNDSESANRIKGQRLEVHSIDGNLASVIQSISDTRIDAFLALGSNDAENLEACRVARAYSINHILSFVVEPINTPDFRGLGVQTLTPALHRGALLALMACNSAIFSMMTNTEDQSDLREFILFNSEMNGKRLMDLKIPASTLVLAIRRKDELIVPNGTTKLVLGDQLTVIGNLDTLPGLGDLLEKD